MKALIVIGINNEIDFKFTMTFIATARSGFGEMVILMPSGHTDAVLVANNDNGHGK